MQAQLEAERRAREEMQASMQQEMERRLEEERRRAEHQQQQMFEWMRTLGQSLGAPLPPMPSFAPPPPAATPTCTPVSMNVLVSVLSIEYFSLH